ncbi:hypothetical protein D3C79_700830 [compost metagenome]
MTAPQGGKQRAAYFGFDLCRFVVLERLGPDGPTDVIDQYVEATETLYRKRYYSTAFAVLLKVGGQAQHTVTLQFMHQF